MDYWIPLVSDYDAHLMAKLKQIKVDINGDGNLQPIHVTYYMPEHEGAEDIEILRPAITVSRYDQVHDITREQSYTHLRDLSHPTDITIKKAPTPMKFFYQFTVLADYQEHENEILRQFNFMFPVRGYITLESQEGIEASYDFFQKSFQNMDTYQVVPNGGTSKKRIFVKVYRYHLYTEIDEAVEETYKKALGIQPPVVGEINP